MVDLKPYRKLTAFAVASELATTWWGARPGFVEANGDVAPGDCDATTQQVLQAVCAELRVMRGKREARVYPCDTSRVLVVSPIELSGSFAGCLFCAVSPTVHNGTPRLERLQELLVLASKHVEAAHAAQSRPLTRPPEPTARYHFDEIIGRSQPLQELLRLLARIVESEATVLIQGESGTGKELVARAIHYNGPRARKPFVVQNCSAFNDNLLESALFGHTKGAFTGAVRDKKGLFEVADQGTFFLDEIGDMSPSLQTKLLRVLEEGTFTPVGSTETQRVDVRVIAATHKDLQAMVERGEFREDLFYRVNVIRVTLPALRERLDDLPLLVEHFLRKHKRSDGPSPHLAADLAQALVSYHWPGNIRELENEIERLIVLSGGANELTLDLLSPRIAQAAGGRLLKTLRAHKGRGTLYEAVDTLEREMIRDGLVQTNGNRSQLAKLLGISRSNLILKISKYGLDT